VKNQNEERFCAHNDTAQGFVKAAKNVNSTICRYPIENIYLSSDLLAFLRRKNKIKILN